MTKATIETGAPTLPTTPSLVMLGFDRGAELCHARQKPEYYPRVFRFFGEMGRFRDRHLETRSERDGGEGAMQNGKPVAMGTTVRRNAVFSIACQIWSHASEVGRAGGACELGRNSWSLWQCRKAVNSGLALHSRTLQTPCTTPTRSWSGAHRTHPARHSHA